MTSQQVARNTSLGVGEQAPHACVGQANLILLTQKAVLAAMHENKKHHTKRYSAFYGLSEPTPVEHHYKSVTNPCGKRIFDSFCEAEFLLKCKIAYQNGLKNGTF